MAIQLPIEQGTACIRAIADVMRTGETQRVCPVCGGPLRVEVSGESGTVWCAESDCFGQITIRGI